MHRLLFIVAIGALAGCDKLWSLQPVPRADARVDGPPDAPGVDAAPNPSGCADKTREGFPDITMFPKLAGCSGAWSIAGLRPEHAASCNRAAGNDGELPGGVGCSATDLCAPGWHVCRTSLEVYERLPIDDRTCTLLGASETTFFATAQSGAGGSKCDSTGTNDVFGCGTYGLVADEASCAPLDRVSDNMCFTIKAVGGWDCPDPDSELTTITKSDPTTGGGVLCCRDAL